MSDPLVSEEQLTESPRRYRATAVASSDLHAAFEVDWRIPQPLSGSFWTDANQDPRKLGEEVVSAICEYISEVREHSPHLIEVRRTDAPEPWRSLAPKHRVERDNGHEPGVRLCLTARSLAAAIDELMTPQIARYLTTKIIEEIEEDGCRPVGDVFAVTAVMPLAEYSLQPGDGREELDLTATCLWTCGHREFGVLEVWATYDEATLRCRQISEEDLELSTPLLVRAYSLGERVRWDSPSGGHPGMGVRTGGGDL